MDGVDVIRSLRQWTQIPIVILSGRMNSTAKVNALDAGADDYVTKPFSVEELLARIRAVARRTAEPEPVEAVQVGRWTVDLSDHSIHETLERQVGGSDAPRGSTKPMEASARQVHLTPTEWQLLQALVRHPGRLVSQRQLLQEVWGPTYVEQSHYLRQYVKALRHKLEDDPTRPRHLITEPGMGYRFQP
jgi:two-component system KDP operon response regulator KdpE